MHRAKWVTSVWLMACCSLGCSSDDDTNSDGTGNGGQSGASSSSAGNQSTGATALPAQAGASNAIAGAKSDAGSQSGAGAKSTGGTATGGTSNSASTLAASGAAPMGGETGITGTISTGGSIGQSATSAGGSATETGGAAQTSNAANTTAGTNAGSAGADASGSTSSEAGAGIGGTGGSGATAGSAFGGSAQGGLTNRPNIACGNGVVDPGEDCDDGNAREDDGCTTSCRYGCLTVKDCDDKNSCTADSCGPTARGFACAYETLEGTACDDGDSCTPTDGCDKHAVCRGSGNVCSCKTDNDCKAHEDGDACNGTLHCVAGNCQIDAATVVTCDTGNDTACRKSECNPLTGVCSFINATDGTTCDDGLFCTAIDTCTSGSCVGTSDPCQGYACGAGCDELNRHCVATSAGTSCRVAAASCDVGESCDGTSFDCPADVRMPLGAICRSASGDCDIVEKCNGISVNCPEDALQISGTVCRASAGPCDVPESCDGANRDCPVNGFASSSSVCRPKAGDCDVAESCLGSSSDCPPDGLLDTSVVCRLANGPCDISESCTGMNAACPSDAVAGLDTVCRAAATLCDITETCDGTTGNCPSNAFLPAGTACNDGQACTVQDSCNANGQCIVSISLAPPAPKLLWPANGWLTGSVKSAGLGSLALRPNLRWEAAASDGCGTVTYELQLDDSCELSALKTCKFASPEVSISGISATNWRSDTDLVAAGTAPVGTAYAWRVRACRNGVCSGWTNPRYVTVGRAPNDFNADGYSDLAIGAPEANNDGRIYLHYGSALGVVASASTVLVAPTPQAGQAFGAALAAGDFDGDGYADLAVGSPQWDADSDADVGRVYLYRGGPAGLEDSPTLTIEALVAELGAKFGMAVGLEGDIDGDGKDDLAIGEPWRDTAQTDEGIVSVHLGHAASVPDTESFVIGTPYPATNANFGTALTLGDANGDGGSDLVAAAQTSRHGAVVYLSGAGPIPIPAPIDLGTGGNAVAANGDTDGSGRINLMFGMNNNMWHGWLCDGSYFYTYEGTASGLNGTGNPSRSCDYGYALGNGGDLDGDGLFDSVAASVYEGPGMVVLFHGTQGAGITGWYEIWNPGNVSGGHFGYALGTRSDFDADGMADLVVTAPDQNAVYVFNGKSTGPASDPTVVISGSGKLGRATPR